jgi:hypothetical protein
MIPTDEVKQQPCRITSTVAGIRHPQNAATGDHASAHGKARHRRCGTGTTAPGFFTNGRCFQVV